MSAILLVQSTPTFRTFVKSQLGGVSIIEAASAVEALDICRARRDIDVLICDVELGLVSGMELASLLRAWNSKLRTILTSDLACDQWTERQQIELKELPADDVLILRKPFTPIELRAALTKLTQAEGAVARATTV